MGQCRSGATREKKYHKPQETAITLCNYQYFSETVADFQQRKHSSLVIAKQTKRTLRKWKLDGKLNTYLIA